MSKLNQSEFQREMGKIEALIQQIEDSADPSAQTTAKELVKTLLELHGNGLERMLEIVYQSSVTGQTLIDQIAEDELVGNLLILHELHPLDLATRVQEALEKVRPYLFSHGGNVELLGITDEGAVSLRLEGSCHGCPSSQITLKYSIEEAIYAAAPDVTAIHVQGTVENQPVAAPSARSANFIPMADLLSV